MLDKLVNGDLTMLMVMVRLKERILNSEKIASIFLVALLITGFSISGNAETYHLSTSEGNDNNPGTMERPMKSYSAIKDKLSSGDIILLKRGDEWKESFFIPVHTITINAYGVGEKPIINGEGIRANGIYVTFSNVKISNITSINHTYAGIRFIGNESNSLISHCIFKNNRLTGLQFYGGYSNSIAEYCYSENNGNGYYADEHANFNTFRHNTAIDNTPNDTDGHGIGIYLSDGCIIEYNTCINNGGGIVVDPAGKALGVIVRYNYMADNHKLGNENFSLGNFTTKTAEIYNNVMVNDRCVIMNSGSGKTKFYNNTIFDTKNTTQGTTVTIMNANDKVFRNNIIYSNKSAGQLIYIHTGSINSDNNIIYAPNTTMIRQNNVGSYNSLLEWQKASKQDPNSFESLPLFEDLTNKNFTPQSGSDAIDNGVDLGFNQDYFGNSIVGKPDIGAIEFQKKNELQTKYTNEDIVICEGSSYNGWTKTGQYKRTLTAVSGGDSIVTTNLTVNPIHHIIENINIGEGENYQGWTVSGEYERILTSKTGCDSIVVTNLSVNSNEVQTINLDMGWNIFSSRLNPNNKDLKYIFSGLIQEDLLIEVRDEKGNTFQKQQNVWVNNIGNYDNSEGLLIKVKSDSELKITGNKIELPMQIHLTEGWNIVSFPYEGSVNAMKVVQPLIDKGILVKVQDEKGRSIENWGSMHGWINGIGNFNEGEGYFIKVSQPGTLTIYEYYEKTGHFLTNNLSTNYFKLDYDGNGSGHMNVNIIDLNESGLKVGDEIAAYYNSICVGAVKLNEQNLIFDAVSLPASVSDDNELNGFIEGEPILLRTWQNNTKSSALENISETIRGKMIYQKQSSVYLHLKDELVTDISDFTENDINVYPNPAVDVVNIHFTHQPLPNIHIIINDFSGKQVLSYETNENLNKVDISHLPTGIYFLHCLVAEKRTIHKLVISKL